MKKHFLFLFLLTFTLAACQKYPAQKLTQTKNGMMAVFSMSPATPAMMDAVALTLNLRDANGQGIQGAQVTCDLTMPSMSMPPNQPQPTDAGNGMYTANTTFTMSGAWRAEVTVTYQGVTTPFTFDFSIR